jgi:hypothetical protein
MPGEENAFDDLGPLHEDPIKNLRLENELLELKMRAEFGGFRAANTKLPPDVENEFLKKVIEYEQKIREAKTVTVAALIGNPLIKKSWELPEAALINELKRLEELLKRNHITVIFLRERDARFQYKFITDELLKYETEDVSLPGMTKCFVYEEFHPDHEITIKDRTLKILAGWFERRSDLVGIYLSNQFIQPDGTIFSREQQMKRMDDWMVGYARFEQCAYSIDRVSYILKAGDPNIRAMGQSAGRIKMIAVTPEGWKKVIEGPFKMYFSCEGGWWSTFFFYMPGFNC